MLPNPLTPSLSPPGRGRSVPPSAFQPLATRVRFAAGVRLATRSPLAPPSPQRGEGWGEGARTFQTWHLNPCRDARNSLAKRPCGTRRLQNRRRRHTGIAHRQPRRCRARPHDRRQSQYGTVPVVPFRAVPGRQVPGHHGARSRRRRRAVARGAIAVAHRRCRKIQSANHHAAVLSRRSLDPGAAGVSRQAGAHGSGSRGRRCLSDDFEVTPDMDRDRSRREVLQAAAVLAGGGVMLSIRPAAATPEMMKDAVRAVIGEAPVKKGKVKLDLPPLVENGNSVPCTVAVESPMTAADYVKAIHIFNEKNPQPNVISVKLGPRAGRASFSTRIRLADSQTVTAIAELSDGSFWSDDIDVIVTLAACVEEPKP